MTDRANSIPDETEARNIVASGLGRAELEFATSICAPLFWVMLDAEGNQRARNGTAFFLDAGKGVFAVTAAHVLEGLESDCINNNVQLVQLGTDLVIDFDDRHRIIARDDDMDIATFCISEAEVRDLDKTVLTGSQAEWPPQPPQLDRGIYFSGFAGQSTRWLSPGEIAFGAVPGSGVASHVSTREVWTMFDRKNWIDVMGLGLPPERFDFGGISGGPMLSVIERHGIRSWALAGVICQGPNSSGEEGTFIPGFEVIKARHASFIRPDGTLDYEAWRSA